MVDIAGLVKGAAEGQGLGNSFLSHINACDGIFHLCRKLILRNVSHSTLNKRSFCTNKRCRYCSGQTTNDKINYVKGRTGKRRSDRKISLQRVYRIRVPMHMGAQI